MSTPERITRALNALREADAKSYLRDGAGDITIKVTGSKLGKADYPQLPEDYEELLRQACGIMGPYFTLLSPGGMEMAGGGLQPGLLEESESFNRWNDDDEPKVLVVGKMSGGVVIIHKNGQYHVVDESARDVFHSYGDIADFIIDTVTRKDKAVRESASG
jgi:exopolyphosphatase/pppGpp-phosphohydrolase